MSNTVQVIVKVTDQATAPLRGITGALGSIGTVAGGIVAADLFGKIGEGLLSTARSGFDFNRSIENATARLNAFTKDADVSQQILRDLRNEAAKTPFAFEDMANAGTNLLPVANQLNMDLMDLVRTAEILAASNPAEGLEGAAFALKEAASGDFTSIIERFNLSRSAIQALKDEGVPNIEIVRRAMADMGLDMDLVGNMSETFDGRLSTLKDSLQSIAGAFMDPIFDFLKEQLLGAQGAVDGMSEAAHEIAVEWGENVVTALQLAKDAVITFRQAWEGNWEDDEIVQPVHRFVGNTTTALKGMWDKANEYATLFTEEMSKVWNATIEEIEDLKRAGNEWNGVLDASIELGGELKEVLDLILGLFGDNAVEVDKLNKRLGEAQSLGTTLEGIFRGLGDSMQWLADRVQDVYNALVALLLLAGQASTAVGTAAAGINAGATAAAGASTGAGVGSAPVNSANTNSGGGIAPSNSQGATTTGGSGGRGQTTIAQPMVAGAGSNIFYMTVNNALDIEEVAYRVAEIIQSRRSNS